VGLGGNGELTGPHSPKGVGIRGSGVMGSVRGKQPTTNNQQPTNKYAKITK